MGAGDAAAVRRGTHAEVAGFLREIGAGVHRAGLGAQVLFVLVVEVEDAVAAVCGAAAIRYLRGPLAAHEGHALFTKIQVAELDVAVAVVADLEGPVGEVFFAVDVVEDEQAAFVCVCGEGRQFDLPDAEVALVADAAGDGGAEDAGRQGIGKAAKFAAARGDGQRAVVRLPAVRRGVVTGPGDGVL